MRRRCSTRTTPTARSPIRARGGVVIARDRAGVLSGLAPALQAGRADVAARSRRVRAKERSIARARASALLVAQAALSVVLLVGAGLFVRSLRNVENFDLDTTPTACCGPRPNFRGVKLDTAQEQTRWTPRFSSARAVASRRRKARRRPHRSVRVEASGVDLHIVAGIDSVTKLGRFHAANGLAGLLRDDGHATSSRPRVHRDRTGSTRRS